METRGQEDMKRHYIFSLSRRSLAHTPFPNCYFTPPHMIYAMFLFFEASYIRYVIMLFIYLVITNFLKLIIVINYFKIIIELYT